jgi:hypothetical protein
MKPLAERKQLDDLKAMREASRLYQLEVLKKKLQTSGR